MSARAKKIPIIEALNIMEKSLRKVLKYASKSCPILLETPAGEGTEVCTTFEEFSNFFTRFENDERLRVCIDTCHVFAAGHEPYTYLLSWNQKHPNTIGLVHFNDSKFPKGSRKDRHRRIGLGYIGFQQMARIAKWCVNHNITMVFE